MDNNDVLKTGTMLLKQMDKEDKDVMAINGTDPFYVLRTDILLFFRQIMMEVQDKELLKKTLESSFLADVKSEELSFQEKMNLYKLISTQSNIAAEGILSLFKPTPGAPSLLADNISKDKEKNKFDELYDDMSSDDLQQVQKFMLMMNKALDKTEDNS